MRNHALEGRKREERAGELRNMACHKQGLTNWRGGRGRGGWGSLKSGKDKTKIHPPEGGEWGELVGEVSNGGGHKPRTTNMGGGRGRSGLRSFETLDVMNEDSLTGGEEEG